MGLYLGSYVELREGGLFLVSEVPMYLLPSCAHTDYPDKLHPARLRVSVFGSGLQPSIQNKNYRDRSVFPAPAAFQETAPNHYPPKAKP